MSVLDRLSDPRKLFGNQKLIDENNKLRLELESFKKDRSRFNELCGNGTILVQIRGNNGCFTKRMMSLDDFI